MRRITPILILPLFLLALGFAAGDVICALGPSAASYKPASNERPAGDVMQLANRVNMAVKPFCLPHCPSVAIFRNATAPNAMLVVENGDAKIVYSPQFFTAAYDKFGQGAILAVLAHEYGHAMGETTPAAWIKPAWSQALRADAWAGCALAKMDLTPAELAEGLKAVSSYAAPSHSAWAVRLPVWRAGYAQCGGDGAKFDSAAAGSKGK
jgi:hypothetical protein